MGFDTHSLNYFRYIRKQRPLGRTVTLGRQAFYADPVAIRSLLNLPDDYEISGYCEQLMMDVFGCTCVDSFDMDAYEGCTYTEDFNKPLGRIYEKYDTVIDGGSLEHIFNVAQVIQNLSDLCETGGQIIHIVPSNNFNGHGLYQFNSEFFYNVYSDQNGYVDTEVFYADYSFQNMRTWWYARPACGAERNEFNPGFPTYILCSTTKKDPDANISNVQSADWQHRWGSGGRAFTDFPLITEIDIGELCK